MAASAKPLPVAAPKRVRCAVYTRKSTDDGLEQEFNTLEAQREAGEACILSQRHEGWVVVPERYDDGGFTGSNMDRPALKRLLVDVEAGKVNCIVVYKVDRLTRSLLDFARIIEILDKHGATFISVTQQFNSTTSSGRLMLNVLFSFAQFEREMISERTRDKMRAARRKGKWIGGNLVLGYDVAPEGGALVVNKKEAPQVQEIFALYLKLGSLIPVVEELDRRGWTMKRWITRERTTRGGAAFNKTTLHNMLTNVIYTGQVKFEGNLLAGEHERIVDDDVFNRVREQLQRKGRTGGRTVRNKSGGLLKGLVRCASCGVGMTHTYVKKKQTIYRYYVCINAHQRGWNHCPTKSVSASLLEGAVVEQLRRFAQQPAILSGVLQHLEELRRESGEGQLADPGDVQQAISSFDPLWEEMNTWEKERFIRLLVATVQYDGQTEAVTMGFHSESIRELCAQ